MLVPVLLAAALWGAPRPPALCVQLSAPQLEVKPLIEALRARIARQQVRVIRCGSEGGGTWRLIAVPAGADALQLILSGPDVTDDRLLSIGGMSREEVAQYVALTTVEAIRPSMDALLGRLGLSVEPPDEAPIELPAACSEPAPCAEPQPPQQPAEVRVEVPAPGRWVLGALPALRLGVQEGDVAVAVELFGGVDVGRFRLLLHSGVHLAPGETAGAVSLSLSELEAGASLLYRDGAFSAGIRAQNRLTIVSSTGGFAGDGVQFFWNGGFGLLADFELWRTGGWAIGVSARAWLWPQPNRFLDAGTPLLTQSHLELGLGPTISWSSDDIF